MVEDTFDDSLLFNRTELLVGVETMELLKQKRVIIFGIGGVGSWTAVALARTGFQHLTLVDADSVAVSNINRQAPATVCTVGRSKVDVMRGMLLEVNPRADIQIIHERYTAETAHRFKLEDYDYVVDAIDSVADKALLIYNATLARGVRLFSSMGAALKMDPTRIRVADFSHVIGCRLAAALRRRMKKTGQQPRRKFKCVFSDELLPNLGEASQEAPGSVPLTYGKVAVNGSLCHITAIFGMTLAGLILGDIASRR